MIILLCTSTFMHNDNERIYDQLFPLFQESSATNAIELCKIGIKNFSRKMRGGRGSEI